MHDKKCLLLIGSPRGLNSTSYKTGNYLLNKLNKCGFTVDKYLLKKIYNLDRETVDNFIQTVRDNDIIILSTPLYVDSLPSFVIKAMELIAEDYQNNKNNKKQGFMAIINAGFPEASQCDTAMKICNKFALETKLKWLGGIKIGGGPAVGNQALEGNKGMLRELVEKLDFFADRLIKEEQLSEPGEVVNTSLVPAWFYSTILNLSWKIQARKNNASRNLRDKPYQ
ncbi:MAG TPA: NAD(P)H-dependent oxidoreductase [Halanaerobiales bacterium]|nr:NAD(P)H-dependent oxidoreductase [Halanaerobiales bacterium]